MMMPEVPELVLNINKPAGITSYDVVRKVKRIIPGIKVGHGGTLDPFAEGVLLILVGRATKQMSTLLNLQKKYEASLILGTGTASGDNTMAVIENIPVPEVTSELIKEVKTRFIGQITQIPPQYSAKKVNGKPAYKYARKGNTVQLNPAQITIYDLHLEKAKPDLLIMNVICSSGTYIRVLGEDIARSIGTCGHLTSLKRTAIGDYTIADSLEVERLSEVIPEMIACA